MWGLELPLVKFHSQLQHQAYSLAAEQRSNTVREIWRALMEAVINDYISKELVRDSALLPLGNTTSLFETDILDSLALLRLMLFIKERTGIRINDVEIIPENFESVDAICTYIRFRAGETVASAVSRG